MNTKQKHPFLIHIELANGVILEIRRSYISKKQAEAVARKQAAYHARQWESNVESFKVIRIEEPKAKVFIVAGCMQGRGMDADKFYDISDEIEAEDRDEARKKASARGIWCERIIEKKEDEQDAED